MYYVTDNKLYSIQQLLMNMMKNIEYLSSNATAAAMSTSAANNIPKATVRMAIAVVGILPILIIYPYVQKSCGRQHHGTRYRECVVALAGSKGQPCFTMTVQSTGESLWSLVGKLQVWCTTIKRRKPNGPQAVGYSHTTD